VGVSGFLPLDQIFQKSDIITLHCFLTEETNNLINTDTLKQMKKSAIIINTSRGKAVDEKALYQALKNGEIAGAGLDVFEKEPTDPDNPLEKVADRKRINMMKRANEAALDFDNKIKMASISYYDEIRGRTIANSEGLLISDELPLLFFIVQTLGVDGNRRHFSRERLSRHSGFEMFNEVSPEQVASIAAKEAVVMLDAEACPAGKMDVVMENGWGGVLVHEAVGHPLEADNIAKKIGAFTGKMGKKVASELFTMVDDGTLPNYRGTTNFDDEGTPMKRNVLIRNGVLEGYMTDILSAKQVGLPRTGNGIPRRFSGTCFNCRALFRCRKRDKNKRSFSYSTYTGDPACSTHPDHPLYDPDCAHYFEDVEITAGWHFYELEKIKGEWKITWMEGRPQHNSAIIRE